MDGIIDQFNASSKVDGARWVSATMSPKLRAVPHSSKVYADDSDQFEFKFRLEADRIGNPVIECHNVGMSWDMSITLERVPYALVEVDVLGLVAACVTGAEFSEAWLSPSNDHNEAVQMCAIGLGVVPGMSTTECQRTRTIKASILNGSRSISEVMASCAEGAKIGGYDLSDVDFFDLRSKWSGEWETSLGWEEKNKDHIAFLGFSDVNGHDLNIEDLVVRTTRIRNDENFVADRCAGFVRKRVRDSTKRSLRAGLTLGLRSTILDMLAFDPVLADPDRSEYGAAGCNASPRSQCDIPCQRDSDCDFRRPGGPVFQAPDGTWRGARHQCVERSAERVAFLGSFASGLVGGQPPGRFCHVQTEPPRINVRPDLLELVLADDAQGGAQSTIYSGDGSLIGAFVCGPTREGKAPSADIGPVFIPNVSPLVLTPSSEPR